jgi:tRNA pseudouridine38-40 synthase
VRWRLDVEYDGAPYAGFQLQQNAHTVQAELERALCTLFAEDVRIRPAGRTDTGVHAEQQVVVFDSDVVRSPHQVREGLNALLPDSIACVVARPVAQTFDPRHHPHVKTYVYTWLDRPGRSPLRRHRVWAVRHPLDAAVMHESVQVLVGTHDFSSFRAIGCSSTHPVRTVPEARVDRLGDTVELTIRGTGFLRHMVRILAGTLTDIGRGRKPVSHLQAVLEARDRASASQTAPPQGLTLRSIRYEGE